MPRQRLIFLCAGVSMPANFWPTKKKVCVRRVAKRG
jgi:hypothetical protein